MKILMRSFITCWKLYSQAVVATLDENLSVIGQINGSINYRSM